MEWRQALGTQARRRPHTLPRAARAEETELPRGEKPFGEQWPSGVLQPRRCQAHGLWPALGQTLNGLSYLILIEAKGLSEGNAETSKSPSHTVYSFSVLF